MAWELCVRGCGIGLRVLVCCDDAEQQKGEPTVVHKEKYRVASELRQTTPVWGGWENSVLQRVARIFLQKYSGKTLF